MFCIVQVDKTIHLSMARTLKYFRICVRVFRTLSSSQPFPIPRSDVVTNRGTQH